jgi:hypothetical protein
LLSLFMKNGGGTNPRELANDAIDWMEKSTRRS